MDDPEEIVNPPIADRRVYVGDIRATHFCTKGARAFFEKYKIDWYDFLAKGIPVESLLGLKDSLANQVVSTALMRINREERGLPSLRDDIEDEE